MAATQVQLDLDLRLEPGRTARQQFHRQIARLEHELATALAQLDVKHRPSRDPEASPSAPRMLSGAELEATRDDLALAPGGVPDAGARELLGTAEDP